MIFNHCSKLAILAATLLSACASPTVVQSVKPGDAGLSCAQLQNEFADAERFRVEADKEKSVTGGNVVRALLFWPAILGTAANANEAIAAADTRKVHITNQMNLKKCSTLADIQSTGTEGKETTEVVLTTKKSKESELFELKKLYDANLITKEAYADRQKTILSSTLN